MELTTLDGARRYLEEAIFPAARQIMQEDGEHYPLAFILATCAPDGDALDTPVLFPFPYASVASATGLQYDHRGREIFVRAIQALSRQTQALGVVYISEAWSVCRSIDDGRPIERPSEAPDRQEILSILLDHRSGRIFCHAPIVRAEGGQVTLGDFVCHVEGTDDYSYGRLVNLLGRAEPPDAEA